MDFRIDVVKNICKLNNKGINDISLNYFFLNFIYLL